MKHFFDKLGCFLKCDKRLLSFVPSGTKDRTKNSDLRKFALRFATVAVSGRSIESSGTMKDVMLNRIAGASVFRLFFI